MFSKRSKTACDLPKERILSQPCTTSSLPFLFPSLPSSLTSHPAPCGTALPSWAAGLAATGFLFHLPIESEVTPGLQSAARPVSRLWPLFCPASFEQQGAKGVALVVRPEPVPLLRQGLAHGGGTGNFGDGETGKDVRRHSAPRRGSQSREQHSRLHEAGSASQASVTGPCRSACWL